MLHLALNCVGFHADSNTTVLWAGVWNPLLGLVTISRILVHSLLVRRDGQKLNCVLIGCGKVVWLEVQGLEET